MKEEQLIENYSHLLKHMVGLGLSLEECEMFVQNIVNGIKKLEK